MDFSVKHKAIQIEKQKQALLNDRSELCLSKLLNTEACTKIIGESRSFRGSSPFLVGMEFSSHKGQVAEGGKITKGLEEYLLRCVINSTLQDVAIKERISYKTVQTILNNIVPKQVDWSQYTDLETLGSA